MQFWDFFWLMVLWFVFITYLMVLFQIISDLFRDRELSGLLKAVWIIALLFFPFLTALIYLIARGKGMGERPSGRGVGVGRRRPVHPVGRRQVQPGRADRRRPSSCSTPARSARQEFDHLKSKALASA